MDIEQAYQILYTVTAGCLIVLIGILILRSVAENTVTDRILCINMITTLTIGCIAVFSCMLDEAYLTDVALIYTLISFVAVIILSSTYLPADKEEPRPKKRGGKKEGGR